MKKKFLLSFMICCSALLLCVNNTYGQTGVARLEGTVIAGDDNTPLSGATVYIQISGGGYLITTTDLDGHYEINVPAGATLTVSYFFLGYITQKYGNISLPKDSTLTKNVTLDPDPDAN